MSLFYRLFGVVPAVPKRTRRYKSASSEGVFGGQALGLRRALSPPLDFGHSPEMPIVVRALGLHSARDRGQGLALRRALSRL